MILKKGYVAGSFGNKKVHYSIVSPFEDHFANETIVLFHGAFSSGVGKSDFEHLISEFIKTKKYNVFVYETSRMIPYKKRNDWGVYVKSFSGKTFQNELADVKSVIDYLCGHMVKNGDLHFVGFSLGGTLASFLINQYSNRLKTIQLFGSGITTLGYGDPILSTYPKHDEILSNYLKFSGKLLLVQGTNDVRVPLIPARRVLDVAEQAMIRELLLLKGVDHTFTLKDDIHQSKAIFSFIANKVLSFCLESI